MGNSNYRKGRRKEYMICDNLKSEGFDIVQRTKGSHSPFDIIAINKTLRVIKFIQSKRTLKENMNFVDGLLKNKIEGEYLWLNNAFRCEFEVM